MKTRLVAQNKKREYDNSYLFKKISNIEWKLDKIMKYLNLK